MKKFEVEIPESIDKLVNEICKDSNLSKNRIILVSLLMTLKVPMFTQEAKDKYGITDDDLNAHTNTIIELPPAVVVV